MSRLFNRTLGLAASVGLLSLSPVTSFAQTPTLSIFHSFSLPNGSGNNADGFKPNRRLIQGYDGNFYGVTRSGGSGLFGVGVAFKITPAGVLTVLHNFGTAANSADGTSPNAMLLGADGNFYGDCPGGGIYNSGTVWKMTPSGVVTVLHTFTTLDANAHNTDGSNPWGGVTQGEDGSLYGGTLAGGPNGNGVVFKVTPAGAFTVIRSFAANYPSGPSGSNLDGRGPIPPVQYSDGNLYGATAYGGANGQGTLYRVSPTGTFTTIHSFNALVAAPGGYTNVGGTQPQKIFLGPSGNLCGVALAGGSPSGSNGYGTLFTFNNLTGAVTTIYDFPQTPNYEPYPIDAFSGTDGNFYVALFGGIDQVTPAGVSATLVGYTYIYQGSAYGDHGVGLTPSSDGSIYMSNSEGGYSTSSNPNALAGCGVLDHLTTALPYTPSISSLTPATKVHGSAAFTITVTGQNFLPNSRVYFNGAPLASYYRTPTAIGGDIPASLIATAGVKTITVVTPAPGGGTSNSLTFTVS
jgi:uncharacterized repeat protein (TIGR03803 family)